MKVLTNLEFYESTLRTLPAPTHADDAATKGYVDTSVAAATAQTITDVVGTTKTIAASDAGALLRFTSSTEVTVTIPADANLTFAIGSRIDLFQYGTGQVTVVAAAGATLRCTTTNKSRTQYSLMSLLKIAANEWLLSGDLSAE